MNNASRQKVKVYELSYAFFISKTSHSTDVNCNEVNVNDESLYELAKENEMSNKTRVNDVSDHVLSVTICTNICQTPMYLHLI